MLRFYLFVVVFFVRSSLVCSFLLTFFALFSIADPQRVQCTNVLRNWVIVPLLLLLHLETIFTSLSLSFKNIAASIRRRSANNELKSLCTEWYCSNARENTRFYHTKATRTYTHSHTHTTQLIRSRKHTNTLAFRKRASLSFCHPTAASASPSFRTQTFKLDVLFSFKSASIESRASKSLSALCHVLEKSIWFSVGCLGTYSLLMAEHNMPIESIIAVDFLMIATIVLFFHVFCKQKREDEGGGERHAVHLLNKNLFASSAKEHYTIHSIPLSARLLSLSLCKLLQLYFLIVVHA